MKTRFATIILATALVAVSCGTVRKAPAASPEDIKQKETLEGVTVNSGVWEQFGFAMGQGLSNGNIVDVPYVFFTGSGESTIMQAAEEIARTNAVALISNTFSVKNIEQRALESRSGIIDNTTEEESSRVTMATNDFARYVAQVSSSTLRGFVPFGKTEIDFNEETRLYTVWARVGMPAKKWEKLYKTCLDYKPKELSQKELNAFAKIQKDVLSVIFQVDDEPEENEAE